MKTAMIVMVRINNDDDQLYHKFDYEDNNFDNDSDGPASFDFYFFFTFNFQGHELVRDIY